MKNTLKNRIAYILALIMVSQHIFYVYHVLLDHHDHTGITATTYNETTNFSQDNHCYTCAHYLFQNLKSDLVNSDFIIFLKIHVKKVLIPFEPPLQFTPFTSLRAPPFSF